jgi:hypothetical protein
MEQALAVEQAMEVIPRKAPVIELMEAITKAKEIKFLTIYNDEQKGETATKLIHLKEVIEKGESLSKELRDPYFQMSKQIKGFFDNALEPVKSKITEGSERLSDYQIRLRKEEEAERKKAQEKLDKIRENNPEIADKIPEKVVVAPKEIKTKTEVGTVFTKKVLKVKVVDMKLLAVSVGTGAVPEGVFEAKEGYIKTLIKGGMKIPGVESWEEDEVATRR